MSGPTMRLNNTALREWRENRGLTKSQMASQGEVSLSYYSELESGLKGGSPPVIRRFADVLKVNVRALIENPNDVKDEAVA